MGNTGLPALNATMRQVPIDGSRMSVAEMGRGHTILLGASYLWDARMWRPQAEILSQSYRIIIPEAWGHGGSGRLPDQTTDLQALARQHLLLMDALGIERFTVIGLSLGGMWGAELAMLAPARVSGLALLDTSLAAEPPRTRAQYMGMLDMVASSRLVPNPIIEALVPLFFSPSNAERQPELAAAFGHELRAWEPERLVDSVVPIGRMIFGRRDATADLARLRMPAIVMTGAHDIPRPPEEGKLMADLLACPFVEVPGAGHISNLEAPEFVTAELARFVERTVPSGR